MARQIKKSPPGFHLDVAKDLASTSGMDLDKMMADARSSGLPPGDASGEVGKARMVSKVRPSESSNVIATLQGSDPKLKNRSGHLHSSL